MKMGKVVLSAMGPRFIDKIIVSQVFKCFGSLE